MTTISSFKQLIVWQKAMLLTEMVYRESQALPEMERFGLVTQIRRAAVSIPSNIAEGSKRGTVKDYVQFLRIADGSSAELETQMLLATELYPKCSFEESFKLVNEVQRILCVMIPKLLARKSA